MLNGVCNKRLNYAQSVTDRKIQNPMAGAGVFWPPTGTAFKNPDNGYQLG